MVPASTISNIAGPYADSIKVYSYYRLLLSLLFLGMMLAGISDKTLGTEHPQTFAITVFSYAGLSVALLIHLLWRRFTLGTTSLFLHLFIDIGCISLITFSSGGLSSGMGFLLIVTVATGSIAFTGRLSLLLAAVASIVLLSQELATSLYFDSADNNLIPTGILGALLFVTALIFRQLNKRLRLAQESAQLQANEAAQLQQLNALIVQRILTGIIVVNRDGDIELINSSAVELLGGHQPQKILGIGQHLRITPQLHQLYTRWQAYPWLKPEPFKNPTGSDIQASFASFNEQNLTRTLVFLEDNRSSAQRAQQLKLASLGQLTGSIAHEIRNPLGAISHAAQLLSEEHNPGAQQAKLSHIISKHSNRLNQIIENVMQLSRQKKPELKKFNLKDTLNTFVEEFKDSQSGEVTIELSGEPVFVYFDASHLQQVLTNLLDNAIRYSKEATEEAWVGLRYGIEISTGHPFLLIEDRGEGVAKQHRDRIFEPFFTTSRTGTGLGLYISRELCEINYATLDYVDTEADPRCFRLGFAHPNRMLP